MLHMVFGTSRIGGLALASLQFRRRRGNAFGFFVVQARCYAQLLLLCEMGTLAVACRGQHEYCATNTVKSPNLSQHRVRRKSTICARKLDILCFEESLA